MAKRSAVCTIISVVVICFIVSNAESSSITEKDTELLLTYVVWRHGARTPLKEQLVFCHDPETLDSLSLPYGYGALTDKGKQQGYEIGLIIRQRYGYIIAEKFNSSQVYFRSTDIDRTKMTGLAAMAALYKPAGGRSSWNPHLPWEPVPYTTVPVSQDYMSAASGSCSRLLTYVKTLLFPMDLLLNLTDPLFIENDALLNTVTMNLGNNYATNPYSTYLLFDTYQSAISLGMTLPSWLSGIWDRLSNFVDGVAKKMFTVKEVVRLNSGVLLYKFLNEAQKIINNTESISQRVQFYSAHDINVAGFSAAINVPPGYMKYATIIALELRKVVATGEITVLPVLYPTSRSDEVQYLQIEGCSSLFCNFDEFTILTSGNAVEESVWQHECSNGDRIPLPSPFAIPDIYDVPVY